MSFSDEQWKFLQDVSKLILKAEELGYKLTGGELFRTIEQQKIYVDSGRSKTMKSNHLRRLAIDLNFFIKDSNKWILTWNIDKIEPLGKYWESLSSNNRWGGHFEFFKDVSHFERNV